MKNVYFISDAHLGSWALDHRRMQERRLVRFLDDIKDKAQAIYMLGDMFDFWYEYKYVVPKGFTRFLGKISELTDRGVEVHYFIGNHDIWMFGYLERECGVILHKEPLTVEIMGKEFFLAHGDGMGDPSRMFSSSSLCCLPVGACVWACHGLKRVWKTIACRVLTNTWVRIRNIRSYMPRSTSSHILTSITSYSGIAI